MSTARIAVELTSPSWGSGQDPVAVAEVTRAPGGRGHLAAPVRLPLGVNDAPREAVVEEGDYIVRVLMPSGDVRAEQVNARGGLVEKVSFELEETPHEWLAAAFSFGAAQALPRKGEAEAVETAGRVLQADLPATPFARALATHAARDIRDHRRALQSMSGAERVRRIQGWRWRTRLDEKRPWPGDRLSTNELVLWWTGSPVGDPAPLDILHDDPCNARLASESPAGQTIGTGPERSYAAVRDPQGDGFYAVYPEAWANTSAQHIGAIVPASVFMTIVVEAALTDAGSPGSVVRWRCVPEVDDLQAMSLLGFLNAGQAAAGRLILERAHDWLYGKTINPVAAAAGAYLLLMHGEEANARLAPGWRHWVSNLYHWFPGVPDGAIAMAQLAMAYGETGRGDEMDVEKLRGYALDAVRRGLPFLGAGVRILTDILIAVQGDDEGAGRTGPAVEDTRRALSLVRQLGRITVPGSFFTVLRLNGGTP